MIGYKVFDKDLCCRGFQFEVGKTYTKKTRKEELRCCTDRVFHFCREVQFLESESGYKLSDSRLCEIIAGDCVREENKYGTNKLTILREITGDEKLELINDISNAGDFNSGCCNSGNRNRGDWNSGNRNSGNFNSGGWNIGNRNSGESNSGNRNSGNWNSGNWNSGYCNSGNRNSGNFNSGKSNSGNWNSGSWNTGDYNTGYYNTGYYNTGYYNSGFFNTDEPFVRMFNKETNLKRADICLPPFLCFDLVVWVTCDTATEEEKIKHKKELEACGGFLKTLEYKEALRLAWDKASKDEHKQLLELPNWDNEIFKEISGIDAEAEIKKENKE